MPEPDLFANFQRMRREMDELFGDVLQRSPLKPRGRGQFAPAVDVFYTGDPPKAVVLAELAGIDPAEVALEVRGRHVILSGRRGAPDAHGGVYQLLEIARGPFRRVIQLDADVRGDEAQARYEDGLLRVELPLVARAGVRTVPITAAPTPAPEEG